MFPSSADKLPDSAKITALALQQRVVPSVPVVFDIEDWSYASNQLDTTNSWFLDVIRLFKQSDTGAMGFYWVVPNDAYSWQNIQPIGGATYVQWQTLNAELTPIADQIHLYFPSFYTFDNDTSSWNEFVQATLSELKNTRVKSRCMLFYGRNTMTERPIRINSWIRRFGTMNWRPSILW